ncbi:MAG TPA: undecaprenyldiphospho-muramoylpentapeptide beta-N-acetylglucosaminyltransferase, partial [Bacteroidota bacterium]
MPPDPNTFLLAGGGTGGHLFPAIAVAEAIGLLRPGATVVFAGTKGRIESRLVPQYGYRLETIWISGIQRRVSIGNLMAPLKILVSLLQSFWLLRRLKPAAVLGTGGYVCGPVLLAASVLGIPTMIHESNSYPGATTKLLAGRVDKVFLAFEDSKQWLRCTRETEIVGTPTRSSMATATKAEALRFFGLSPDRPVMLISGGSQGSAALNAAVFGLLDNPWIEGVQLVWQTGEAHFAPVNEKLKGRTVGWVGPFIGSMELAYAAADLVVCRAGAATIAELTRAGKPSVLIPYPHAVADHQTRNA